VAQTFPLSIKIFADGADVEKMLELARNPQISGFTTNPTLMRSSGVTDYVGFAHQVLEHITDRPISFEVFSDDFDEMERQAHTLSSWGENVYVKIPITNTKCEGSAKLIRRLSSDGVKLNVTAILSLNQVRVAAEALEGSHAGIVSVFAGRIADTGKDPVPLMAAALHLLSPFPALELLWASPREVLNLVQADSVGCHIITATPEILKKIPVLGRDLDDLSLDTVKMFRNDAVSAGFSL
jgi:transaldolase